MEINIANTSIGSFPKELLGDNRTYFNKKSIPNGGNSFGAVGAVTAGTFNLANGNFKVDENGHLSAKEADISGKITSSSGNIGSFNIGQSDLTSGQPWALNDDFLSLNAGDFIFRKVGGSTSQVIEATFGYAGLGISDGLRLKNTIGSVSNTNTALSLEAREGVDNYALNIQAGKIKGGAWNNKLMSTGTTYLTNADDFLVVANTGAYTFYLPNQPEDGKVFQFVRNHGTGVTIVFVGNGRNILFRGVDAGSANTGGYWGTVVYVKSVNKWFLASNQ